MDGLLSADECRLLIALARPVLQPSRAIDLETGKPIPLSLRTMSDVTFDPVAEDLSLRMVQQRMATAAGVEFFRAESLRVMRQEAGDEVLPPVGDYLPPGSGHPGSHVAGNRAHTICVYLNQPEAGGEIQFPAAGFNVKTQTARAVIFDNLQADGSPDLDSQHSALPVKRGEKWLATLWLREGRYRNF